MPVVLNVETITLADVWGERAHVDSHHELVHVLQGRATIRLGRRSFRAETGSTFVIPAGASHLDVADDEGPYKVLMAFFDWAEGEELLRSIDAKRVQAATPATQAYLAWLASELQSESLADHADDQSRAALVLVQMLLAMARSSLPPRRQAGRVAERRARERHRLQATKVRELLQAQYREPPGLDELAAQLGVSRFHLSRSFSREFGLSITDMLTTIRMEHAREMLSSGEYSIKQVAAAVGYANGHYFAKVFRRVSGLTPSEFQLMIAERAARRAGR
jgi:AraC-like DNA-binding protein